MSWADIVLLHLALLSAFIPVGLSGRRRSTDGAVRLLSLSSFKLFSGGDFSLKQFLQKCGLKIKKEVCLLGACSCIFEYFALWKTVTTTITTN